jgi:hypothetical protein
MSSRRNMQKKNSGKKPTDPKEGVYVVDSDQLAYAYVSGNYSDQGCVTVTWDNVNQSYPFKTHNNHKGGTFKIHPQMLIEFLQKIGVTMTFETDRKHSYCKSIELKPWSEFEQAVRGSVDRDEDRG